MRRARVAITVAALALASASCGKADEAPASGSAKAVESQGAVTRGPFERRVFLTGELDAINSVDIVVPQTETWQLTISWLIEDGTAVKKGERVIEFDNSAFTGQLESQRVLVKQADRDHATQRHLRAMTIADKENAVKVGELERDKAAIYAAVERDLISERTFQERQLALERAEATLVSARADLESARRAADLDLKVKRVAAEKARRTLANAEEAIAALTITAPEDGVAMISSHPWMGTTIMAGDTVQPGWTVVRLPDLDKLSVTARLSDVDDGHIKVGMAAEVYFDAEPTRLMRGRVESISAVAREQAGDSLLRSFGVEVILEDDSGDWARPGMSARVEVIASQIEDAMLVPRAALRWDGTNTNSKAFVTRDGGDESPVVVLDCDAHVCALESGVDEGAQVRVGVTP